MNGDINDQLRNHMLDFMKLFYDGKINQLHEYSDLEPDIIRYFKLKYLCEWYEFHKAEDYEVLSNENISIKHLSNLRKKFIQLYNIFILPIDTKSNSSFNLLAIIYYKFNMQAIQRACDEVKSVLNSYSGSFNQKYLINHENFQITNFYQTLPLALSEIDSVMALINENFNILLMEDFVFTSHFTILKTFYKDIQNQDFSPDELFELSYNWSVLFLKGFALSQIDVKLTPDEFSMKKVKLSDDEYEKYCNTCWRIQTSHSILRNIDICEAKLKEILRNHSNSKSKEILIPFVQVLIPHYKNLTMPEGYLRLTVDKSREYERFTNNLKNSPKSIKKVKETTLTNKIYDEFFMFEKYIYGLYMDEFPFVLINSPGDSYMRLFKDCVRRLNFTNFECQNSFVQLKAPCCEIQPLDEVTGSLDNLMNQKYYMVYKIIENIVHCAKVNEEFFAYVNTNTAGMFISILPWKIDRPSEEAREMERRIMENAKYVVKNSPVQSILYEKLRKFVIKNVWNAKKPLEVEFLKSKINPYIDDSCNIY